MTYDFKLVEETAWAAVVAAVVFAGTAFLESGSVTDWRTWALSVLAGAARAAVAVVIAALTTRRQRA